MKSGDEAIETKKNRARELAQSLVEEAWNLGTNPLDFAVEYQGAVWNVSVE